jgi:hypothetical protein
LEYAKSQDFVSQFRFIFGQAFNAALQHLPNPCECWLYGRSIRARWCTVSGKRKTKQLLRNVSENHTGHENASRNTKKITNMEFF